MKSKILNKCGNHPIKCSAGSCRIASTISLYYESVRACVLSCLSCLTLCDFMDCSPPASLLEWGAMPSSRGSSQPRVSRPNARPTSPVVYLYCRQILLPLNHWGRLLQECTMEWSRAKANRVLPRERTGHSKHPLPTTQEKTLHMDITRWSIPKSDWLYSLQPKMEKLYTVSKNKTGSWLWLRSWTPYYQIQT